MRTRALRYPKGTRVLLLLTITTTITTTPRLLFLMCLRLTCPPLPHHTAHRNQVQRRLLWLHNDTSLLFTARNTLHPHRNLPSRRNMNSRTRQAMVLSSIQGHMLRMAPVPPKAPHTLWRIHTHPILCTPRSPLARTILQTRIPSPTERHDPVLSHPRCRRLLPVTRRPPNSKGTRHTPRSLIAQWTVCKKSPTGELMVEVMTTSKSLKTV